MAVRIRKFLEYLGRPLFLVTVACVFSFQCYWLFSTFHSRKEQFIEQITLFVQQKLIDFEVSKISDIAGSPNLQSELDAILEKAKKDNNDKQVVIISGVGVPTNPVFSDIMSQLDNEGFENILFNKINHTKSNFPAGTEIIVYHYRNGNMSSYPTGKSYTSTNTTKPITSSVGQDNYFQVHITNINSIILRGMVIHFVVTIAYLLIFFVTVITLMRANKLSKRLLESKNSFTRNMTHELKIPLSTAFVAAEALSKPDIVADSVLAEKYLGAVSKSLLQLSDIISTILDNARLLDSRTYLDISLINLNNLAMEVIDSMELQLVKSGAKVLVEIESDIFLKGDYAKLKHVFLNLIDNALKYAERQPYITISSKLKGGFVILSFKDNARVIPS